MCGAVGRSLEHQGRPAVVRVATSLNRDPCTHPLTIRGILIKKPFVWAGLWAIGEDGYDEFTSIFGAVSAFNLLTIYIVEIVYYT
jgi:hypothetical protein